MHFHVKIEPTEVAVYHWQTHLSDDNNVADGASEDSEPENPFASVLEYIHRLL